MERERNKNWVRGNICHCCFALDSTAHTHTHTHTQSLGVRHDADNWTLTTLRFAVAVAASAAAAAAGVGANKRHCDYITCVPHPSLVTFNARRSAQPSVSTRFGCFRRMLKTALGLNNTLRIRSVAGNLVNGGGGDKMLVNTVDYSKFTFSASGADSIGHRRRHVLPHFYKWLGTGEHC